MAGQLHDIWSHVPESVLVAFGRAANEGLSNVRNPTDPPE